MTRENAVEQMTIEDALNVLRNTNAYGTMDIAKTVILKYFDEQKSCEDAISRQAVLDEMADAWKHICYVAKRRKPTKGEEAVYHDMIGTVRRLSSVNPQSKTGWIPISERLPGREQYALITVYNQTKMCWYQDGVFVDGEQNAYTKENEELVAWMPLPKPYEPQESEDKG